MIIFAEPTREMVRELATKMRPMDQLEVKLSSGLTPEGALLSSIMSSDYYAAVLEGDSVIAICGCSQHPQEPNLGIPWFLGSPRVDKLPVTLVKMSREWVMDMNVLYPTLANAVYEHHHRSRTFLRALGFTEANILNNYGVYRSNFILFTRNDV